jgi:hypothetical protein
MIFQKYMKIKDFIWEVFLRLTSKTCPHGYEDEFVNSMSGIFPNLEKDTHGNYFYKIGDSRTIFTSHIDTVSKDYTSVVHVIEGNIVKTDGNTTLGADDKAGTAIMLWMIRNNVPGLYYFFVGEEVGCIGSGLAAKYGDFKGKYDRIISFDRKGTNSVITHQSSLRSCSDKFANDLCRELNKSKLSYKLDDTGVYTDSAEFVDVIAECTNISVGYYSEHTFQERQDLAHLVALAEACVKVNWENLSTSRNPNTLEYKKYKNDYNYSLYNDTEHWGSNKKKKRNRRSKGRSWGNDSWYQDNSSWNNYTYWCGNEDLDWLDEKPNSKSYYSNGDDLVELKSDSIENAPDKYDWILQKFSNKELSGEDLQFIKENYLDMNCDFDKYFVNYLMESQY